jgi:hypothetical protein
LCDEYPACMNQRMTKVEANVNTDTMCDAVFVHEGETLLGKNELGLIETWYDCARTSITCLAISSPTFRPSKGGMSQ